jgi:HEAT repeat protein
VTSTYAYRAAVDELFAHLIDGDIPSPGLTLESGWEMTLPRGETVTRSALDAQAQTLVALGPQSVPRLLHWVRHENLAVSYVAIRALQKITGLEPFTPFFDNTGDERAQAIDTWHEWYLANTARP